MANEFIARKGLIVLNNGAKVTGSLAVLGDINATGYNVTASNLALLGSASIDGDITIGGNLTVGNADVDVIKFLAEVSSSILPDVNNAFDFGSSTKSWRDLYVSGTAYIDTVEAQNINLDSITVLNNLTVDGDTKLGNAPTDRVTITGSLSTTGVHTIENTTNSTNYTDGALIVAGGVGIAKDVNISGSLTVTGLLTAVSMSTQYVTSSEYTIGTSRIILNDDDLVRFGGISVVDSGSSAATGSLLWDSLKNHWIYQREDGGPYKSSVLIAGPKNYGALGDEEELVVGRIPVATGGDHIDTNAASSSIYIDFTNRKTYVEAGLYVTGSVTSSVGFAGDGSQLTGIVSNLNLSGSQGGTGTVALKTQALTVSGSNGIAVTVSGQTVLVSGSNATTTARGVAAFTGSNFTVAGGVVSSNPINFNGANINLGGTHAFGLQNITPYGASTTDQVSLQGGAVINGVLFTSASNSDVDTGTEIVASVSATAYDAAFFDYVIKKGNDYRAGTVVAVWNTAQGTTEFTDFSTNDLGSTTDVVFSVDLLSNTARLKATVASDNWIIKAAVRAM